MAAKSSSSVGIRSAAAKRLRPRVKMINPVMIVKDVIDIANLGE